MSLLSKKKVFKNPPLVCLTYSERIIKIELQYVSSSYDGKDPKKHSHCPDPQDKNALYRVNSGQDDGAEIGPATEQDPIEYFFASDASEIIEHTNRVLYLHDNDVASVLRGKLTIHRLKGSNPGDSPSR